MPKNKKLILCVDDNRDSVSFLVEWLKLKEYEVLAATSCAKARSILQQHQVALSIIDVRLEDCDGFDLCKDIQAISPTTKAVLYSGDTRPEIEYKALAVGAKAFIRKPIDLHHVTTLVEELLS